MPVPGCDRIDYRDAESRIVVDEDARTIAVYLNKWMRYLFQVDEIEIKKGEKK